MIPIYEQGSGRGVGHGLDTFIARFDEICRQHKEQERAKAFAFIFYDFTDSKIRAILKDQGVFAKLDRLSGDRISIFYLHTGNQRAVSKFNEFFLQRLDIEDEAEPPCVVFFKLSGDKISDVSVAALDSDDLVHGFKELYDVIDEYVEGLVKQRAHVRWFKGATKLIAQEVVVEGVKKLIGF